MVTVYNGHIRYLLAKELQTDTHTHIYNEVAPLEYE